MGLPLVPALEPRRHEEPRQRAVSARVEATLVATLVATLRSGSCRPAARGQAAMASRPRREQGPHDRARPRSGFGVWSPARLMSDTDSHGHHQSVLGSHEWRTSGAAGPGWSGAEGWNPEVVAYLGEWDLGEREMIGRREVAAAL